MKTIKERAQEDLDEGSLLSRDIHLEAAPSELGLTYEEAQEKLKDPEILQARQRRKVFHFHERQLAAGIGPEWGHDDHPEPDNSGDAVRELVECEAGRMWMTRKGDLLEPEEMTAAHLANTIFFLRDPDHLPQPERSKHPWVDTALAELRLRLSTRAGAVRAVTEDADDIARGRLLEIAEEIGCEFLDQCPVCGEVVYVTGSTKYGHTIGSCGDAYYLEDDDE